MNYANFFILFLYNSKCTRCFIQKAREKNAAGKLFEEYSDTVNISGKFDTWSEHVTSNTLGKLIEVVGTKDHVIVHRKAKSIAQ